jgi:hypothetical protein
MNKMLSLFSSKMGASAVSPVCFLFIATVLLSGFNGELLWAEVSVIDGPKRETADHHDRMSARIDALIGKKWKTEKAEIAPRASNYEFLRRLHLDLTGIIPSVNDVHQMELAGETWDRRACAARLLQSSAAATHLATSWRARLLPEDFDLQQIEQAEGLQRWLQQQFAANRRFDDLVADFLVASGTGQRGPGLFYTALETKPEKLAASTARVFLGLQIQCAQCHDHPFDDWQQEEFWSYAAFFAQVRQDASNQGDLVDLEKGDVLLPVSQQVAVPKYPKGPQSRDEESGTRRRRLAIWMVSRDNPYLSRATVNWAWAHLFGRGLVDPIDDFRASNPASHPELLQELADYFVEIKFDLRQLLLTLTSTQAYGLSSIANNSSHEHPEWFSAMATKVLTAEQLFDSLELIAGFDGQPLADVPTQFFPQRRRDFIIRMRSSSHAATDYDAGLSQALLLMNGSEVALATDLQQSRLLAALQAPFFSEDQRLETIFLAALSRPPTAGEIKLSQEFIASTVSETIPADRNLANQGDPQPVDQAYADILWALVNSAEFIVNH